MTYNVFSGTLNPTHFIGAYHRSQSVYNTVGVHRTGNAQRAEEQDLKGQGWNSWGGDVTLSTSDVTLSTS